MSADQETRNSTPIKLRSCTKISIVFVALHSALLIWGASRHSPTWDEVAHLPAGLSHWQLGRFDLFRVNPPLVRLFAALPPLAAGVEVDWTGYDDAAGIRSERLVRHHFLSANGSRVFFYYTMARWICIPFSWIGAFVCFRWANDLYGERSAVLAVAIWCCSPNVIAHAQCITPDLAAAAVGVSAHYSFWRWMKAPSLRGCSGVSFILAAALLTKLTWLFLIPIWLVLLLWGRKDRIKQVPKFFAIVITAFVTVNACYLFEHTGRPLREFEFASKALGGTDASPHHLDNRFCGTSLGLLPVPLPANYVMGIDLQKSDFEQKMWSYLRGEWKFGGWWWYYLYAIAVKVPLGILLVLGCSTLACIHRLFRPSRDEIFMMAPAIFVFALVSSQTGFSHHLRYVLPCFPFAFIFATRAISLFDNVIVRRGIVALAVVGAMSSLWAYPHSLSFFNVLAGGCQNGGKHLGGIPWIAM